MLVCVNWICRDSSFPYNLLYIVYLPLPLYELADTVLISTALQPSVSPWYTSLLNDCAHFLRTFSLSQPSQPRFLARARVATRDNNASKLTSVVSLKVSRKFSS